MKKTLVSLILLSSILISSFAFAISEQEARTYIRQNVCIIRDDFTSLYTIYGMIVDIFKYEGEWYLLLKMTYRNQKEMIINLKNILRIRKRYKNE